MTFEQVVADWREKANTLRVAKAHVTADTLDQCLADIARAGEPYLRWLNETDAHLYSGRSVRWLRGRRAEWVTLGLAKRVNNKWYYLMCALPIQPNVEAVIAEAERDAREDAA